MDSSKSKHLSEEGSSGLYDPEYEHDNCGFGFIANIKNHKSHQIIKQALEILENLDHRGAVGADPLAGDGAGILIQVPDKILREEISKQNIPQPRVAVEQHSPRNHTVRPGGHGHHSNSTSREEVQYVGVF